MAREAEGPVLELDGVRKSYGSRPAVADLTLSVRAGEILALLGPNGAGKTTTVRMVAGLVRPDAGTIRICGHDVVARPVAAKRHLGYVPDDPYLYPQLTGLEHLQFAAGVHRIPPEAAAERTGWLARAFGMEEALGQRVSTYSHGMRHKLAWMLAVLHRPQLLVVDEPTVGLDAAAARLVRQLLDLHRRGGGAVLLTTHVLPIAEALADRVAVLDRSRLVAAGTLAELRARAGSPGSSLEEVFLALTGTGVEQSLLRAFAAGDQGCAR